MADSDWWLPVGSHCSGEPSFAAAAAAICPSTIRTQRITGTQNYVAVLSPAELEAIQQAADTEINRVVLSIGQARTLKSSFEALGNVNSPMFFKIAGNVIIGVVIPQILVGLSAAWLFDRISEIPEARPAKAREIALFVAEGGFLIQTAQIVRNAVARYVFSTIQYEVRVGTEIRSFIFYACLFPVKVVVSRFRTESPFNNKVVQPVNGVWGIFDEEGQSWDDRNFRPTHQTVDSMFFLQDEYENGQIAGQGVHQLSLWGGSWDRRHYDMENFATIYPVIKCL